MSADVSRDVETFLGRLLVLMTYLSVVLLAIGVGLMFIAGISPLDGAPPFDAGSIPGDVIALRPTGFLWLGILAVLVTPIARVIVAGISFARARQWVMVLVAAGILVVIAASVASAALTEV